MSEPPTSSTNGSAGAAAGPGVFRVWERSPIGSYSQLLPLNTSSILGGAIRASQLSREIVASPTINPDPPRELPSKSTKSILIFSGGSAANSFVSMLQAITDDICYVLPVSDDGGSTSEIVKVVGGPGIGDIRSRLVRLAETKTPEAKAVHSLLSHRLPVDLPSTPTGPSPAKVEWSSMVEGDHRLWEGISQPYRETIRAFLLQFHLQILRQSGSGLTPTFDFRGGSIGNFFLTGCRLFFNSLDAAIFQFARITRSPSRTDVLPIVATGPNAVAIAARLRDGTVIVGQCEISHPGTAASGNSTAQLRFNTESPSSVALPPKYDQFVPSTTASPVPVRRHAPLLKQQMLARSINELAPGVGGGNDVPPLMRRNSVPVPTGGTEGGAGVLQRSFMSPLSTAPSNWSSTVSLSSNLVFSKTTVPPLPSPIRRVFYINPEHSETFPTINSMAPHHLSRKRTIIYSMGSLYTSIIPCLIVPGVGRLLADEVLDTPTSPMGSKMKRSPSGASLIIPTSPRSRVKMVSTFTSTSPPTRVLSPLRDAGFSASFLSSSSSSSLASSSPPKTPPHAAPPQLLGGGGLLPLPSPPGRTKILILNGTNDRETPEYTALDFVLAITDALNHSILSENEDHEAVRRVSMRDVGTDTAIDDVFIPTREAEDAAEDAEEERCEYVGTTGRGYVVTPFPPRSFITHLVYNGDGEVEVDVSAIEAMGIRCVRVSGSGGGGESKERGYYDGEALVKVLEGLIV